MWQNLSVCTLWMALILNEDKTVLGRIDDPRLNKVFHRYHFLFYVESVFIQVARAGRFGTKGLAISFVSDEEDAKVLNDVQDRFEVNVSELPGEIDVSTYIEGYEPQR